MNFPGPMQGSGATTPFTQQPQSAQGASLLGGNPGSIAHTVGGAIEKTFNSAVNFGHNFLTGDRDYQRQHELAARQETFNSAQADKERKWQEHMSNTHYQRGAADLKAAGYNPALVTSGSGAGSHGGASASAGQGSAHQLSARGGDIISLIGSALRLSKGKEKSDKGFSKYNDHKQNKNFWSKQR